MKRLSLFLSVMFSASAVAESDSLEIQAGAALLYSPTYLGDDDYQLSLVPAITMKYGDFFASKAEGVGVKIVKSGHWDFGFVSRLDFGRRDDGEREFAILGDDSQDLVGLSDVDMTVELGFYGSFKSGAWSSRIEVLQGIGGHEGLLASADLKYSIMTTIYGKRSILSVGPRIDYGDNSYASEFFDVTAAQSTASGLTAYDASGGLSSYGLNASMIVALSERYTLIGFAGYTRLAGDIANSSLVRERGSKDQLSAGIALSYKF